METFANTCLLASHSQHFFRHMPSLTLLSHHNPSVKELRKCPNIAPASIRPSLRISASSLSLKKITHIFESHLNSEGKVDVKGTVVLHRDNLLDIHATISRLGDNLTDLLGNKVEFQLISLDVVDPKTNSGILSETAYLEGWNKTDEDLSAYSLKFSLDKDFGVPGAIQVINHHPNPFLLKSLTLEFPDKTQIHFLCDSWIYNSNKYTTPRIFFSNHVCLPWETPAGLKKLRDAELALLQGDGTGERKEYERIYDYDVYNDLGDPDRSKEFARPVLGGSKEYPYPRRCRTGRSRTRKDLLSERPTAVAELVYVPPDERFGHEKISDFVGDSFKSFAHGGIPAIEDILRFDPEFTSMKDMHSLYSDGINLSQYASKGLTPEEKQSNFKHPAQIISELTDKDRTDDPNTLKFPYPSLIKEDKHAWKSDEESARQRLSGLNPLVIEKLKVFPPVSKLDPAIYGPPTSAITAKHIEKNLEGLTAQQALDSNRLFTVDYHDVYLPYLTRINRTEGKGYASRTLLFLTNEGTLKPVAIELSLPPTTTGEACSRRVFTPPPPGQANPLWDLAKAHANANDAGIHQLVSHWLRTHASVEPFIIATNRHLSALHPLHVFLKPHFKNTININALARKLLINSYLGPLAPGGLIEKYFTPQKYSIEMSSALYKGWRFDEQSLPADLLKRGMAVKDPNAKNGLKLLVEDYPYANDGLDIWSALENWVKDYVFIQYEHDKAVAEDTELQKWWEEIREIGHGDKADEKWWVSMKNREELVETLTTLIWVASAHHAAVNFGQYMYGGFVPNNITMTRRLIPEEGTKEYKELLNDPEKFYLRTINNEIQSIAVMGTVENLSTHASDEEYLGQRAPNWSSDERVLEGFKKFRSRLVEVEEEIKRRNADPKLKNRRGNVKVPYTLLIPSSTEGVTGRGIPNSISI